MSTPSSAPTFRATRGLGYLAGTAVFGVGVSGVYAATGLGLPCPFLMATGWECPLCGGTRLGSALLHGDLVAAFLYNPVVLVGLVVVSVLGVLWTLEALGGPAVRLPARVATRVARVHPTRWLVLGLVAAAAFVVLRNLL
ncbi:DUF2752 domain-containing protein [Microlunatus capsulatus]|uniref:DUF2752 domain-containing protein n=1 Tax=Microlunatus capsulatus TaxID=99117 RepID=A0ABS4ZDJ5_9ACTN|nr:DUF2752 domain-containing protein [Microlunatus capsulatus]MBP2418860.1 hypothetical protein [Microlunatus capsulatus]